jgi:hypothetical protein
VLKAILAQTVPCKETLEIREILESRVILVLIAQSRVIPEIKVTLVLKVSRVIPEMMETLVSKEPKEILVQTAPFKVILETKAILAQVSKETLV